MAPTKRKNKPGRNKNHKALEDGDTSGIPKSMVFHTGDVNRNVLKLEKKLRAVMEPNTAAKLRVKKRNVLKDFTTIAGPLGVTNFMILSETTETVNMRVARVPRGPTLTFKAEQYSLNKEIQAVSRRPFVPGKEHLHPALLIMNNFEKERFEHKLVSTMFQNMFPPIDVKNVRLGDLKRCVLLDYNKETDLIEFRHFQITVKPSGLSRAVKKIAIQSKIPNLSRLNDIADFVQGSGALSDSEPEDEDANVSLPQSLKGPGNKKSETSAIRLKEIGVRMTLRLMKIEQGMCEGEVLYHALYNKTEEEIEQTKKNREKKASLKAQRKKEQEENIERKKQKELDHKKKCEVPQKRTAAEIDEGEEADMESDYEDDYVYDEDKVEESDDDNAYYKEEVGIAPEEPLTAPKSGHIHFKKFQPKPRNTDRKKSSGKSAGGKSSGKSGGNKNDGKKAASGFLRKRAKRDF